MRSISFLLTILMPAVFVEVCLPQDSIVPRNRIAVETAVSVEKLGDSYQYSYEVQNRPSAEQGVWQFWLIVSREIALTQLKAPRGWDRSFGVVRERDYSEINWGTPGDFDILPGDSLRGFSFLSESIPGIVTYYVEGYAPAPSFEPGFAPDSIPGYDDLTPFGPGVVGQTVGPTLPPSPFIAINLLETLISYKHQALEFGWIDNERIANSLDAKLNNVKKQLERGKSKTAKNALKAFLNEVEAQKFKHLSSEAYALLKFNGEFLLSKL